MANFQRNTCSYQAIKLGEYYASLPEEKFHSFASATAATGKLLNWLRRDELIEVLENIFRDNVESLEVLTNGDKTILFAFIAMLPQGDINGLVAENLRWRSAHAAGIKWK